LRANRSAGTTYLCRIAGQEGGSNISAIFTETAEQEKEHAKRLLASAGGEVEIARRPAGVAGTTAENLAAAAAGKLRDNGDVSEFQDRRRHIQGTRFSPHDRHRRPAIAMLQRPEQEHRRGKVFKKAKPVRWVCRNCGYVHEGTDALKMCPACAHPQAHFEVEAANY
jgi:rubrerythrin